LQEEVEQKTVTLAINATKLTGRTLKAVIAQYLRYQNARKAGKAAETSVKPCGKQTLKELVGQNQGVANIEITDKNIKDFEKVARKYGVDYALRKDRSGDTPKYLVFFKARDGDALTAAFQEYTAKTDRKKARPSVLQKLRKLKQQTVDLAAAKERKKELER
jgi:hypothetical protein